jgi:hypothetical protein
MFATALSSNKAVILTLCFLCFFPVRKRGGVRLSVLRFELPLPSTADAVVAGTSSPVIVFGPD